MDYSSFSNPTSSESTSAASNNEKKNKKKRTGGGGSTMKLSTDPQSVAARQRRHRISDRFKILQSLVPGGSKMDTVSMLEEAIQYVKFLKTQIWLHQTMINFADNNNHHHHHHISIQQNEFSSVCHHQQVEMCDSCYPMETMQFGTGQVGFPCSNLVPR